MRRIFLPVLALFALAAAGAPPAAAQAQQQQPPQQQQPGAQAPSIGGDDLKSYAVALVEVRKINDQYMPQFQGASTQEEREAIQQEATEKMVEAIRAEGITVEQYNTISRAAEANPDLARRINREVEEAR
jgi:hypothetical protein